MAVVTAPFFATHPDSWRPSRVTALKGFVPSGPMTDIMSYQYPRPPPQNGSDVRLPPPGYLLDYAAIPPSSAIDLRSEQDPSISPRDRRDSLSKALKVKSVRPQQPPPPVPPSTIPQHAGMGPGAAKKRRIKPGYHRTSVACGHCRRRKIRCVPSSADVQGRCVNCTRLKKECSFYPVDQQPPVDPRQKSGSRSSVGPKMGSASSSPAIASGHPSDMQGYHPQVSMPSIQNMDGKLPSSASTTRGFEYWRSYPRESSIMPAFSPYTSHAQPSAAWTGSVGSESSSREYMSYDRKSGPLSADMYPSQIATTIPGVDNIPGTTPEHSVPLSAGAVPPPSYGSWQPQSYTYSKPSEGYGGWYHEHSSAQTLSSNDHVQHPPEQIQRQEQSEGQDGVQREAGSLRPCNAPSSYMRRIQNAC